MRRGQGRCLLRAPLGQGARRCPWLKWPAQPRLLTQTLTLPVGSFYVSTCCRRGFKGPVFQAQFVCRDAGGGCRLVVAAGALGHSSLVLGHLQG